MSRTQESIPQVVSCSPTMHVYTCAPGVAENTCLTAPGEVCVSIREHKGRQMRKVIVITSGGEKEETYRECIVMRTMDRVRYASGAIRAGNAALTMARCQALSASGSAICSACSIARDLGTSYGYMYVVLCMDPKCIGIVLHTGIDRRDCYMSIAPFSPGDFVDKIMPRYIVMS